MRQVLRYPVGQDYRKILNDTYEWFVITDLRLKPIVMERGIKGRVTAENQRTAFRKLLSMLKGNSIRVYVLHTHPGHYRSALSESDLRGAITTQIADLDSIGIIIMGNGVITEKEIVIVKLPHSKTQVAEMRENVPDVYTAVTHINLKKVIDRKKSVDAIPDKTWNRHVDMEGKKALKTIAEHEKYVRVKTVRRTHRERRQR